MLALIMALAVSASEVHVLSADTVFANGRAYRLYRIDAPQSAPRAECALESERAAALATFVNQVISSAHSVEVEPGFDPRGHKSWPNDRYGVRLARISVDGRDLGDLVVARGYAFRWDNHNRRNWCLPQP